MFIPWEGADGRGRHTENAGTLINDVTGSKRGKYTYLSAFGYTDGGTQHTITIMKGQGYTTVTQAQAAGDTTVTLTTDPGIGTGPGAIATNDYISVRLDDGSWHLTTVTVAGLVMTITAIPTGRSVLKGARVVFYGVPSDTVHNNYKFLSNSNSTRKDFPPVEARNALLRSNRTDEPLAFSSANNANAGTLEYLNWAFSRVK